MKRLVLLFAVSLLASGCGLGSGSKVGEVTLTVSRDFGARRVSPTKDINAHDDETVMTLLQNAFTVQTRYGGGFVQQIDGVSGGHANGNKVDWFYYVNGVEASDGAAHHKLSAEDRVWWDNHDWDAAMHIPAVVGAFPEPFLDGIGGKKLPTQLVCLGAAGRSCDEVEKRLENEDVTAVGRSDLANSIGETLRILVGTWKEVRQDITARQLEAGPGTSGVFAKPSPNGKTITLLNGDGKPVQKLGAGTGLVAATSYTDQEPTWIITGTDQIGVASAAAALTENDLDNRFAIAISNGRATALPLPSS